MDIISKCKEELSEDNVHQFRTKTRRINFMVNVFNKYIKNNIDEINEIKDILKPVFKNFGDLRDLQLQVIYLENLVFTNKKALSYISELKEKETEATKNAQESFDKLDQKLLENKLSLFRIELKKLLKNKNSIKKISKKLKIDAKKIYKNVNKKVKKLEIDQSKSFHKLRIKFKKYRYTMEVLKPIYGFKKKYLKKLKSIQDELGDIQDIQVRIDEMKKFVDEDNEKLKKMIEQDQELITAKMNEFYNSKSKIKKLWKEIN